MNTYNTLDGSWPQLSEYQQGSVLDVIYERGVFYMRIKDYLNAASTCSQWREALMSNYYQSLLREMHLVSTSLFQRFVSKVKEIDRTDSPKSCMRVVPMGDIGGGLWAAAGVAGGHPDFINERVPQSQKEYEIQALETARAHADSHNNPIVSFDDMDDQDRNNLLDVVNDINLTEFTTSDEMNEMPIWWLMESHSSAKKQNPKLETTLLRTNILGFERSVEAIPQFGLFGQLILLLIPIIICCCYWQVMR